MSKFKVGDKFQWKFLEDDIWEPEVYTVVDEHPMGYRPKGTLVGVRYGPEGEYSGYVDFTDHDVQYRLVPEAEDMKFKVGDKVKPLSSRASTSELNLGYILEVSDCGKYLVGPFYDNCAFSCWYLEEELELVEKASNRFHWETDWEVEDMKFKVGDKVRVIGNQWGSVWPIGYVGYVYDTEHESCRVSSSLGEGVNGNWYRYEDLEFVGSTIILRGLDANTTYTFDTIDMASGNITGTISDNVNHPSHYNESGIECIDAIRASLGAEGFEAYCKGNCMKYLWRYQYKNGLEDLKKAQVYLNWMVESLEEREHD